MNESIMALKTAVKGGRDFAFVGGAFVLVTTPADLGPTTGRVGLGTEARRAMPTTPRKFAVSWRWR